jgi:hypothetical protein
MPQENPVEVPGCDLARNPKAFDGKLIRVRGTLNVHFDDFSLGIRNCDTEQDIWLAFWRRRAGDRCIHVERFFQKARL